MKKILYLSLVALALASCGKKSTPKPVATTVTINGTVYPTVVIGNQTWTSVNYNGPGGENYNNSATNIPADGKLYTMDEAQAITPPPGWRLPLAADYNQLLKGLGGLPVMPNSADYSVSKSVALQLMSTTGWTDTNGNNQLGFNARPVGFYSESATQFLGAGTDAFLLISTPAAQSQIPLNLDVSADQTEVNYFLNGPGDNRWSVRFVKDN